MAAAVVLELALASAPVLVPPPTVPPLRSAFGDTLRVLLFVFEMIVVTVVTALSPRYLVAGLPTLLVSLRLLFSLLLLPVLLSLVWRKAFALLLARMFVIFVPSVADETALVFAEGNPEDKPILLLPL